MDNEKRSRPRGQVSATAVLVRGDQALGSFRVLNLSVGGALLVGRAPADTSALEVLVRLSTGRTIRAGATVVREDSFNEASVFAISLEGLSPPLAEAISSVVLTALEDAQDATVLVVAGSAELGQRLRRELGKLGHPSFAVTSREDALMFLDAPNVLTAALLDLGLDEAQEVLTLLAQKHAHVRRIVITAEGQTPHPLAHTALSQPWKRAGLVQALG